jgi:hypothetical protein
VVRLMSTRSVNVIITAILTWQYRSLVMVGDREYLATLELGPLLTQF